MLKVKRQANTGGQITGQGKGWAVRLVRLDKSWWGGGANTGGQISHAGPVKVGVESNTGGQISQAGPVKVGGGANTGCQISHDNIEMSNLCLY